MPYPPGKHDRAIAETLRLFASGMTCAEIANSLGVERPAIRKRLIKAGVWKPNKVNAARGMKGALKQAGRPKLPPAPPVEAMMADREPCSWCGVRADYGCRHQRIANAPDLSDKGGEAAGSLQVRSLFPPAVSTLSESKQQ
jgi:hypothetical protein